MDSRYFSLPKAVKDTLSEDHGKASSASSSLTRVFDKVWVRPLENGSPRVPRGGHLGPHNPFSARSVGSACCNWLVGGQVGG